MDLLFDFQDRPEVREMKQIMNPYLPLYEYVPDGEPHVFEGRVYIYGSHDVFHAFDFCKGDYVTYSASIDDLTDWRYEGVIYPKVNKDPLSKNGKACFYAPDVTRGNDGKYYLYYSYAWSSVISVAVSSSPKGTFEYLGHVHYPDGGEYGLRKKDPFAFDPAIFVDDDKRIYLYSGFGALSFFPQIPFGHKPEGGFVMELEPDMLTIKGEPKKIMELPGQDKNTPKEHGFFEASSMRKIDGRYYFVYSSLNGHELCYQISSSPMGPFVYGGVIISNGDVGYKGRKKEDAIYPLGNNHGSILTIGKDHFIFYHRHTNYTNTDRQAMAERIHIDQNGRIEQVEKTTMGLNPTPLSGKGTYPSSVCSTLVPKEGNVFYPFFRPPFFSLTKTYITQKEKTGVLKESQYIHNVRDDTLVGYKYFDLSKTERVVLEVEGDFKGKVLCFLSEDEKNPISKDFSLSGNGKERIEIPLKNTSSKDALFFRFVGKGKLDFFSFTLE